MDVKPGPNSLIRIRRRTLPRLNITCNATVSPTYSGVFLDQAGNVVAQYVSDSGGSAPFPGVSDISELTSPAGSETACLNYNIVSGNLISTFKAWKNRQVYALSTLFIQKQCNLVGGSQLGFSAYTIRDFPLETSNIRALKRQANCAKKLPERVMEMRIKK